MSKSGYVCLVPDDGSSQVWVIAHPTFPSPALVSFHREKGGCCQLLWHKSNVRDNMIDYDVDFVLEKWQAFKEANK